MPLFGPPNVKKLEAKQDVKGLIKALGYQKDYTVRGAAAEALGWIGDKRAVEPLIAALDDKNRGVYKAAARALGRIGDARAVKPLVARIWIQRKDVHQPAAEALGQIGTPAVKPLIDVLEDKPSFRSSSKWKYERWPEVAAKVAEVLGQIGDARAVEPLIATLKVKRGKDVRQAAAEALGQIGAPAVKSLIDVLEDRENLWAVREAAAEALGQTGEKRAVEALTAVLRFRGEYREVRWVAAKALERLGRRSSEIQAVLSEAQASRWIADRKWDKAVEMGEPAVAPLISALNSSRWEVRRDAAEALVKLYRSGKLSTAGKRAILAERPTIVRQGRQHVDRLDYSHRKSHSDSGYGDPCGVAGPPPPRHEDRVFSNISFPL